MYTPPDNIIVLRATQMLLVLSSIMRLNLPRDAESATYVFVLTSDGKMGWISSQLVLIQVCE